MWVVKELLNNIGMLISTAALMGGIIAYGLSKFIKWLPGLSFYKMPLEILGIIACVIGSFFIGVFKTEQEWQEKVSKANARAELAEQAAKTANAKIEYVFLDRVQKVKDVQVIVKEQIRDISVKIDENCKVSQEAIDLVNAAARNQIQPKEPK